MLSRDIIRQLANFGAANSEKNHFRYAESRQNSPNGQILEQQIQRKIHFRYAESRQNSPKGQILEQQMQRKNRFRYGSVLFSCFFCHNCTLLGNKFVSLQTETCTNHGEIEKKLYFCVVIIRKRRKKAFCQHIKNIKLN